MREDESHKFIDFIIQTSSCTTTAGVSEWCDDNTNDDDDDDNDDGRCW